jgi:peptide/nickel transport system permease protein
METDGGRANTNPLETLKSRSSADIEDPNIVVKLARQYVVTPLSVLRHDWRAIVGFALVSFYILMGTIGTNFVGETGVGDGPFLLPPFQNMEYPLGTDDLGRDLFAVMVYSTDEMLIMMGTGAAFTVVMGGLVGITAGYKGGAVDSILSTVTDIAINLPGIPVVLVLSVIFQPKDPVVLGLLLSLAAWSGLARALRSQVLTLRNESFVESGRAMGIPDYRILLKSILPHLAPYMVVNLVQAARNIIFAAAGLYFIGVLPFDQPNWGVVLNWAYEKRAHQRPELLYWLVVPCVTIIGISIGLILLAQSLDRVFNPRLRAKYNRADVEEDEEDVETESTDGEVPWV